MAHRLRALIRRWILLPIMQRWFHLDVTGSQHLPRSGPVILVANHNSHLDTAAVLAALPPKLFERARPVAAADYFLRGAVSRWFFLNIVRIVPVHRDGSVADPLRPALTALDEGAVLILYPEGTRGEPGTLAAFRPGVAHLAKLRPLIPIIPMHLEGCAEALPRGTRRPRRTPIALTIGPPVRRHRSETAREFCGRLRAEIEHLERRPRRVRIAA